MQIRCQLLSRIVFLNDDLHKQKQFMYTPQLLQLSAVVNHRLGDKYKGKCVNKVLYFLRCTCIPYGGEKHFCQVALFSGACLHIFPSNQSISMIL